MINWIKLNLLTIVLAFGILTAWGLSAFGWIYIGDLNREQETNREAIRMHICTELETIKSILRSERVEEVRISKAFLKRNPQGTGAITAEIIQQGIERDERVINQLSSSDCERFAKGQVDQ